MRKQALLTLCAVLWIGAVAHAQNPSKDEKAIRSVVTHWQSDWNRHDFKSLGNLLTVDTDYVTDNGTWLQGREEFVDWHAKLHPQMYLNSHWTNNQLTLRFLQPDIAIVHLTWGMEGDLDEHGKLRRGRSGISTWVFVKLDAGWKIRAGQDTSLP